MNSVFRVDSISQNMSSESNYYPFDFLLIISRYCSLMALLRCSVVSYGLIDLRWLMVRPWGPEGDLIFVV